MNFGRSVGPKTTKNNWFFNGSVKFEFLIQVGPRDQKSMVFGPQKGSKSELWRAKSGSKIDKNSRSKKRGSKVEKSELKSRLATQRH